MGAGYIKVDRKILENGMWLEKPFDYSHAWIDLLLLANWKDFETVRKGQVVSRKRGEVNTTLGWLAERWGWSMNKVRRYIGILNRQGMCTSNGTPNGTTLTIENYTFYQGGRQTNGTPKSITDGTSDGITDGTHEKKGKESKRIANKRARAREGRFASLLSQMEDEE